MFYHFSDTLSIRNENIILFGLLKSFLCLDTTGFPRALEIMENLENHKKSSMHGKIMEFEKKNE